MTAVLTQHQWRLGKYIVGSRLGGGMTNVHLATNTTTDQQVVLKLIAEADDDASAKIHAEGRGADIQKQLAARDTRIPKVFEWGHLEGYFYIEMEYIHGKALDRSGKVGSGLAVTIALEVCEVLELAHSEQIIHGDIKPGNILDVSSDDDKTQRTTVKVLDFGVSRFLTSETRNPFRSVPYSSPEIGLGKDPAPQDDLWSLCVTIYELVEGRLPFVKQAAPLFVPDSHCPPDLRLILQKMFSPDIRARYQTASELRADLKAFHNGKPVTATPGAPVSDARLGSPATVRDVGGPNVPNPNPDPNPNPKPKRRLVTKPIVAAFFLVLLGVVTLTLVLAANTMMGFVSVANAARPDDQASIMEAAKAYKELDAYGGIPKLVTSITSGADGRLRDTCLVFAGRIIAKYARELDLPEKGNVSEREWKAAMDVLAVAEDIERESDVRAMRAYVTGHYHRINAESRIGITADSERKKKERAAGVDHYAQAEEYFAEALRYKPEWLDAQFGLVRLYATVFPEMNKAEIAMNQAQRWSAGQPLRLQFEMALG